MLDDAQANESGDEHMRKRRTGEVDQLINWHFCRIGMTVVSVPKSRASLDDSFRTRSVIRNAKRCRYACASEHNRILRVLDNAGQFRNLLLDFPIRVNDFFGLEVRELLFSC